MKEKELIHQEDFISANVQIRLRNLVSETVIDSKVKMLGNSSRGTTSEFNHIQLLEILPKSIVLSVPKYTCTVGHSLELNFRVTNLSKLPFEINLLGKVTEVEKTSDEHDRITVDLKISSSSEWTDFCQLFSKRQNGISDFFKKVKGF